MERKFQDAGMQSVLEQCVLVHRPRVHKNPTIKKREYTVEYQNEKEEIRLVICYFEDADGSDQRSIRYMKTNDGLEFGAQ